MKYKKSKITSKELDPTIFFQEAWHSWQTTCLRKDLCQYLMDVNGTIDPLSWYEILANKKNQKKYARNNLLDLIIVHINFDAPEVEIHELDVKYNIYDKIATFGGTIGLCEQITGASILTLIHLIVLIIKAIFNHYFIRGKELLQSWVAAFVHD